MRQSSRGIDRIAVTFDEPNLVANAGLVLVATLAKRLGLESSGQRPRHRSRRASRRLLARSQGPHARPRDRGRRQPHRPRRRAARRSTAEVLGHRVMAPSTLGTFLRAFTFGHVRQLEAVIGEALAGAWAGRRDHATSRLVVDVDSTIVEVARQEKAGRCLRLHQDARLSPVLATRADTGEVLHARMRKGSANTQRASSASSKSWSPGYAEPGRSGRSCALRLGLLVERDDRDPGAPEGLLHDGRARRQRGDRRGRSRRSPRSPGRRSTTPKTASPRSPRRSTRGGASIVRRTRLVGPPGQPCGPTGATSPF